MDFLRRWRHAGASVVEAPRPLPPWHGMTNYDLPTDEAFAVAGLGYHRTALARIFSEALPTEPPRGPLDRVADLWPDSGNRHDACAVGVWVAGQMIGYIPRTSSKPWATFLRYCNNEGYHARGLIRLWTSDGRYGASLFAHKLADYRLPSEIYSGGLPWRLRERLAEHELLPEEHGFDYPLDGRCVHGVKWDDETGETLQTCKRRVEHRLWDSEYRMLWWLCEKHLEQTYDQCGGPSFDLRRRDADDDDRALAEYLRSRPGHE